MVDQRGNQWRHGHVNDTAFNLFNGKTILVVDDEPELRELLSEELESWGSRVLQVDDGAKAYEIIQKEHLDLIISDVRMPGMGGIELLEKTREACGANLPKFFLITGFSEVRPETAVKMGAEAVLMKPFNFQELRAIILKSFA